MQGALADTAVQPGDDADTLGSGAATDGHVLTSDGAGGAAWEAVPGASAPVQSFVIACSDEATDLTTGTAKVTFRMPFPFTVDAVRASVTTAPTGANLEVDINEGCGTAALGKMVESAVAKGKVSGMDGGIIAKPAADAGQRTRELILVR